MRFGQFEKNNWEDERNAFAIRTSLEIVCLLADRKLSLQLKDATQDEQDALNAGREDARRRAQDAMERETRQEEDRLRY